MRKKEKKQAENFLNVLGQTHHALKKMIEDKKISEVCAILSDCQQGVIELGNMIEHSEGEDCKVILLLQEYCELVYQVYQLVESKERIDADQTYKHLQKMLLRMENSVKNDIVEKLEVVFLPYKASMWDSLESVWKAADDDPACDAYVVPIPYYDKNIDGSFRERHYEGNLYPSYVPVVNYRDYDLADRQPDIVFIHNPYDECNYVTSIEPFYYSKNLIQYTGQLIYIPYFVLTEIQPGDILNVAKAEPFCTVPGVFYADKVIVQSKNMRQVYVDILTKVMGENSKNTWQKKILGIGSPKFDKAANTRKEDLKIPKEWLKIIQKSDGSWKKVIFYNTSVSALLQDDVLMLEKMQYVFDMCKEYQDVIALLWRPHPLIKATISSMRPHLQIKYEQIVQRYREEGWGIYDDSSDLDRAVIISDAYYGDGSSVVQVYQKTGKPIMMQNVYAVPGKNDVLTFENVFEYKNFYILYSVKDSKLCKLEKESLRLNEIVTIPCRTNKVEYKTIYLYKSKVYFIPFAITELLIYDLEQSSFRYIKVPIKGSWRGNYFSNVQCCEDKLFLFPAAIQQFMYIDLRNDTIHVLNKNMDETYYSQGVICCDNVNILFAKTQRNELLAMNKTTGNINIVKNDFDCDGWSAVCEDKSGIWFVPYSADKIFYFDKARKESYKFNHFPEGYIPKKAGFTRVQLLDEKLFLIPGNANMLLIVDTQGNIFAPLGKDVWEEKNIYEKTLRYSDVWIFQNQLYIYSAMRKKIINITDISHPIFMNIADHRNQERINITKCTEQVIEERESISANIAAFIEFLTESSLEKEKLYLYEGEIGTTIYQEIKDNYIHEHFRLPRSARYIPVGAESIGK